MYSRLKKRKIKMMDIKKPNQAQKTELLNFPTIINKKDNQEESFNSSRYINRKRAYFLSSKKMQKNEHNTKSFSLADLAPLERSDSNTSKASNNANSMLNLNISSKNWCLYDSKRKKYYGFRQDYQRQIASLTKIMTTFLTLQLCESLKLSLDCKVKISQVAASMIGTTAQLKKNYWISLQNLLYGTMLPSGNDAAYVLAQYMGYLLVIHTKSPEQIHNFKNLETLDITNKSTVLYVQEFVLQMNNRAKKLGLLNTRFSNPHGLQNALNVSTAKDIILLSTIASSNIKFKIIMNSIYWKYEIYENEEFRKKITKQWWNTNKLLYKDWEGIKTGHTSAAGCCLSSLKRGIFIVVLNSQNLETRFSDTEVIFDWYSKNIAKSQSLQDIEVQLKNVYRYKTQSNCVESLATDDSI